jgi:hypothetical protein
VTPNPSWDRKAPSFAGGYLLTAVARVLAGGDTLDALKRSAVCEDPPALAVRGIAMAQLGEYLRVRELLKQVVYRFGTREAPREHFVSLRRER